MSWCEAKEDRIPVIKDKASFNGYYPPCHICGTPVYSWSYVRGTIYTCPECRKELVRQEMDNKQRQISVGKSAKLDGAVKRISKHADISGYAGAIKSVDKCLNNPGWFQSTEEIMTALELIHCGLKVHHQVRIFDYTVDFILPEMKVALEIDGPIYHGKDKQKYQAARDEIIANKLGGGWQVIRISTEDINTNITRLIPAIKGVIKYRQTKRG